MRDPLFTRVPPYSLLFLTLILAVIPYFLGLGGSSLWDSNEAFYAQTPREMIESDDYLNPSFNFKPRFNKPPLSYWVVAAFYHTFTVSEAVERLAIALGAAILIATAFSLARLAHSTTAGLCAAIALATMPRFFMFSRRIMIDIYISMFLGLALLFFTLAEFQPRRRRLYLSLMYSAVGLGIMTKGPVAAVLPAIAIFIYLAVYKELSRLRQMMPVTGLLMISAIVVPWYAAIYLQHGWEYIYSFLLQDNFSRYTQPVWGPRRGFFFYIPVILGDFFPWSLLLALSIWFALKKKITGKQDSPEIPADDQRPEAQKIGPPPPQPHTERAIRLFLIWTATIVAFFSLSRNKEDLYILPICTAAAALVGILMAQAWGGTLSRSGLTAYRVLTAVIALLACLGGGASLMIFAGQLRPFHLAGAASIGVMAMAAGAMALVWVSLKQDRLAVLTLALLFASLHWVFALVTLPDFERFKPIRPFSERISRIAGHDALIGYYRFASPSMAFYLNRPIFEYYGEGDLQAAFASGQPVYVVMTEKDYHSVRHALPATTYVLARCPIFQVKLRGILDSSETPQALLISNRGETVNSE